MKTAVVYASKYGCTADCAAYLKANLAGETTLIDVNKASMPIGLEGYDTVLIGGSVYVGKVSKKLRLFCEQNLNTLSGKRLGFFLCCALTEEAETVFAANFPADLLQKTKARGVFGSEARLEKMGFFDKKLLGAVTKGDYSNFKISYGNLDRFIKGFS